MESKAKFVRLRDLIRGQILAGALRDGDALPAEQELAVRHRVSRVTVRKALGALKAERVVASLRGSGTRVTLRRDGFPGALDMVVLVAPTYEPFFAEFFHHFEAAADRNGTVVVFKQDRSRATMAEAAFYRRFLDQGVRDFVLWPGQGFGGHELLPRLRGLGGNVVFFDHFVETPYADCVHLDNGHAVAALVAALRARGCGRLAYLGWSDVLLSSTAEREQAFRSAAGPEGRIFRVSKLGGRDVEVGALFRRLRRTRALPDGVVCVNAQLGHSVCERLRQWRLGDIRVATVDALAPPPGISVCSVVQPLKRMAERAFWCLENQNRKGGGWRARRHAIEGTLSC